MKPNWRVVIASIVGAGTIHLAFMACGSMSMPARPDGGMLTNLADADTPPDAVAVMRDVISDVVRKLVDAEIPRAEAGIDAGVSSDAGAACSCAPIETENSFSAVIDRGNGPESPTVDYSTATTGAETNIDRLTSQAVRSLSSSIGFWLPDGTTVTAQCGIRLQTSGELILERDGNAGMCSVNLSNSRVVSNLDGSGRIAPSAVRIVSLTNTQAEWRITGVAITLSGSSGDAGVLSLRDLVFRVSNPRAHFLTPTRAYRP
jgi:hypothetical protein